LLIIVFNVLELGLKKNRLWHLEASQITRGARSINQNHSNCSHYRKKDRSEVSGKEGVKALCLGWESG
jgi:hypothetical protein